MLPSAGASPLREILEGGLAKLLPDLESAIESHFAAVVSSEVESRLAAATAEVRTRARVETADRLNQTARRLAQAEDAAQLAAALVDGAGAFATGAALFRVGSAVARGQSIRGVTPERAAAFSHLEIALTQAAAMSEAIKTRDPVTAMATAAEISAEFAEVSGQDPSERVGVYPLIVGDRVPAVLCAWGVAEGSAVELLTQITAAALAALPAPANLVAIEPVAQPEPSGWDALSPAEQQVHLRAQRAARVQVAEIRLLEAEAVQTGRTQRDLYGALKPRIDTAREAFRQKFFGDTPSMVDYLHLELVETLANSDADSLGKEYPGPMV
jgi:hypothetical protein